MKKENRPSLQILFVCLGAAFLIGVWAILAAWLKSQGNHVVLYPHEAVVRIAELFFGAEAPSTYISIGWTLLRLILGFLVAFVLGVILGTLGGLHRNFDAFMKPLVVTFRTIPTAAVVILFIGIFMGPKNVKYLNFMPSVLTFMVAFPLIYQAFITAMEREDEAIIRSLDLEVGHKSLKSIVQVLWPDAMPFVWMSIGQGLGLSLKVTIMSEVLSANSATRPGLGVLIVKAQTTGKVEDIIPYSLIALLLMAIIDIPYLVLKAKEKKEN